MNDSNIREREMLKEIASNHITEEYIAASNEVKKYINADVIEPAHVAKRYKLALDMYRGYLDKLGMSMLIATHPYKVKDISTHKFLDVKITGKHPKRRYGGSILNPDWKGA